MRYHVFSGMRAPRIPTRGLGDLFYGWSPNRHYLAAENERGEIVGFVQIAPETSRLPGALALTLIEVARDHRGQGVAHELVRRLFKMARRIGKPVFVSDYCPDGERYLKPFLKPLGAQMQVKVVEFQDVAIA